MPTAIDVSWTCLKGAGALQELLAPLVTDTDVKIDVAGFAALSLGLVFTSTCNGDAIEAIIQALMMRGELELSSPFAKFLALGLGLLFLGRQEAVEPTVEVLHAVVWHHLSHRLSSVGNRRTLAGSTNGQYTLVPSAIPSTIFSKCWGWNDTGRQCKWAGVQCAGADSNHV